MQPKLIDILFSLIAPFRTICRAAAIAVVLAWTLLGVPRIAAQPPPAPSGLTATAVSGSRINLSWVNNPPLGTEIRIFRSTDGITFMQINTLNRTATAYNDTALLGSVPYFYQVRAHNMFGDSDPSNTASDVTWPVLRQDDICPGQISLAWTAASVDDHYDLQRCTRDGTDCTHDADFTVIATIPAPANSYTDSGLEDGNYVYRLQAFRTGGAPLSNTIQSRVGGPGAAIDHSDGFASHDDLTANGNAAFVGDNLRLTEAVGNQGSSVFFSQPPTPQVDISSFSTSFTFRIHDPTAPDSWADGMAFVIQNDTRGANALGPAGGGLGYGPDNNGGGGDCRAPTSIRNSVAIKLDIWDNVGEGTNSTGIFTDGRSPTLRCPGLGAEFPDNSVNLQGTPIQLRDDHAKQVDLTYDGNTLTEKITDLVTMGTFTTSYTVDIPSLVGSSTAYVGFTGATGGVFAVQEILTWTWGGASLIPRPPKGLRVTNVSGSDVTIAWKCNNPRIQPQGYKIERSDNGGAFMQINMVDGSQLSYTDPGVANGTYCYRARSFVDKGDSIPSNEYCISLPIPNLADHSVGFGFHDDLQGNAESQFRNIFVAGVARLTTGGFGQAGSVFTTSRVDVTRFTNTFTFQICVTPLSCATPVPAEGITFTIQGNAPTARGSSGGALGYGGIANSVAVKFDIFDNQGETDNSTGLFTGGDFPGLPSGAGDVNVLIDKTVLDLKSGDAFQVDMAYDAATLALSVTITDTVTLSSASQSYTVDIPSAVGSNFAYVGFTGATSLNTARQDIQTWTFQSGAPARLSKKK